MTHPHRQRDLATRAAATGLLLLAGTVFCATAAGADVGNAGFDGDSPGPMHPSEAGLRLTLTSGAWLPRLGGDARFNGTRLLLGDDLALRDTEPTFNAELTLRKHERWELHFGGFHFATSGRGEVEDSIAFGGLSLDPGDSFRSDFEMTSVSGELRLVDVARPLPMPWSEDGRDNRAEDGGPRADLRFIPAFGVRWVGVDHRFERVGGGSERGRGEWAVPYAGFMLELTGRPDVPLINALHIEGGAGIGPALGGYAWHVRAGVTWQFHQNLGLMFGYRLLELNVKRDDYHLRGGLQGLFIAGSIRF